MDFVDNGKDAYMAMFSVSLPIYRKKYKASISEAKLMQQSFQEMKIDVANALATEFEEAVFERDKSVAEMNLYSSQTERKQQVVDLLLTGYGNSGTDFEEILRMQQMLLKYKMNTVTALTEYKLAEAKLLYLVANDK